MVGVGSPKASQVRVTCSSISEVVWFTMYVILGLTVKTKTSHHKCTRITRQPGGSWSTRTISKRTSTWDEFKGRIRISSLTGEGILMAARLCLSISNPSSSHVLITMSGAKLNSCNSLFSLSLQRQSWFLFTFERAVTLQHT